MFSLYVKNLISQLCVSRIRRLLYMMIWTHLIISLLLAFQLWLMYLSQESFIIWWVNKIFYLGSGFLRIRGWVRGHKFNFHDVLISLSHIMPLCSGDRGSAGSVISSFFDFLKINVILKVVFCVSGSYPTQSLFL